ncbi:hypothetical protein GGX14DRAFT_389360 [Mycena pura]|uniref:Uncharacterized protein n=1 Tax=Mycena pura TaxID=153505 RepID=A0AAD6YG74_9AGAR|nr:hypothetical protein GGX14DRAFT_389360 [Mycena pura]
MTTRHLICLPGVHPYPFPAEDTARYYVVVRGLNPGIYRSRELASFQLSTSDAFWVRAVGWNAAWRVWCSHCFHRHCHTPNQTEVHVIEEIIDEPLSEPLSPDPEWSALPTGGCHSAGTPPPSPNLRTRDEAFLTELNERLRTLERDQFMEVIASDPWVRQMDRIEEPYDSDE